MIVCAANDGVYRDVVRYQTFSLFLRMFADQRRRIGQSF